MRRTASSPSPCIDRGCSIPSTRSSTLISLQERRLSMDFELSEEHQFAYESALGFAQKEIRPRIAEMERDDAFPAGLWHKLGEQGFTGLAIPEEYGGSGGGIMMAALVASGIGRPSIAIAIPYFAHLNPSPPHKLHHRTE